MLQAEGGTPKTDVGEGQRRFPGRGGKASEQRVAITVGTTGAQSGMADGPGEEAEGTVQWRVKRRFSAGSNTSDMVSDLLAAKSG